MNLIWKFCAPYFLPRENFRFSLVDNSALDSKLSEIVFQTSFMVPRSTRTSDPEIIHKNGPCLSLVSAGELSPNFENIYWRPKLALFMYFRYMNFFGYMNFLRTVPILTNAIILNYPNMVRERESTWSSHRQKPYWWHQCKNKFSNKNMNFHKIKWIKKLTMVCLRTVPIVKNAIILNYLNMVPWRGPTWSSRRPKP